MAQLLHALITHYATATPAALALRDAERSLSYGALAQAMRAAAQGLLRLGLQRGERVAVLMEKRSEAVLAIAGAWAAGLACVPIDARLKPQHMAAILRDSGARLLVTTPRRWATLAPMRQSCPALRAIVLSGPDGGAAPPAGTRSWDACMRGSADGVEAQRCGEHDLAVLLYESHGEQPVRGLRLTHRDLVSHALRHNACLGIGARDRIGALPCFSCEAGLNQLVSALAGGAAAVLMQPLFIRDIGMLAERERLTVLAAPPLLWNQLAQLHWERLPALRYALSAGGPLPRATLEALRLALPGSAVLADGGIAPDLLAA